MVFKVILTPSEDGGYTATVPALPGCVSEGETVEETMANIREAIELHLEPFDEPEALTEGVVVKELAL
jgi:predicted RNase H-like HicB family nuclease